MNDDENVGMLEARYRECAEAYGTASELGDSRVTNRNHDKLVALVTRIRAAGSEGETILRRLMRDRSDAVAAWAATHSLPFAATDALEVLDTITKKNGVTALDAMMTARRWRAGKLKVD